jgi:hypothetical protein
MRRALWTLALSLAALPAPAAEPIPPYFRTAFLELVHKGSYAVVKQGGIPFTPVHGADGKQVEAYFSIDVKNGAWTPSTGLMDTNQLQTGTFEPGEVMEVVDVTFKDGRIDLRLVSVEPHDVQRPKSGPGREPVSTNFKFFFPFRLRSGGDLTAAWDYVGQYLQVFRRLDQAQAHAAQAYPRAAAAPAARASTKATVKTGMTPLDVLEALGKPKSEVSSGARSKWVYPELSVIFENGRVTEVVF